MSLFRSLWEPLNASAIYPQSFTDLLVKFQDEGTFTRASNATMWTGGVLTTVGNDVARFDRDPITDVYKGLLIEEARTNVALNSEDFSTTWSDWKATRTYNTEVAPDGNTTADTLTTDSTASSGHWVQQYLTASITNDFCFSVYLKQGAGKYATVRISDSSDSDAITMTVDLNTGLVQVAAATGGTDSTLSGSGIEDVGDGWYRVWISGIVDTASTNVKVMVMVATSTGWSWSGNGTDSIHMWGGQMEQGVFPTSYISTAGATATRSADVATLAIGDWHNLLSSTYFIKCESFGLGSSSGTLFEAKTAGTDRITLYVNSPSTLTLEVVTDSVLQSNTFDTLATPNVLNKIAFTIEKDSLKVYVNGVEVSSDNTITPPRLTTMWLGNTSWGGWVWDGWLDHFGYHPRVLTATEIGNL